VLLLGQLLVLIMCVGYMEYFYSTYIYPDKRAKETFREVNCFLVNKKLSTRGHILHSYRPDFLVSYNVNGVQYNRWVSGNGLDTSYFRNKADQEDILSQYEVGGTYLCYFNPANAQFALLVLRHNWLSTLPLMVPATILVIVFYYFLQNLMLLLSTGVRRNNP
jgi:hypothetical protein